MREVDPRVRNAALGFTGATQDLPFYTAGGSELLVFRLGETPGRDARRSRINGQRAIRSCAEASSALADGNAQPQ